MELSHDTVVILISIATGVIASTLAVGLFFLTSRLDAIESGVLGNVPCSVVAASLAFVILEKHVEVVAALYAVPLGIFLNVFFLYMWRKLPPLLALWKNRQTALIRMLFFCVVGSILMWIFAFFSLSWLLNDASTRLMKFLAGFSILFVLFSGLWFLRIQTIPSYDGSRVEGLKTLYPSLGILIFICTSLSVFLSTMNEVTAGILITFPSVHMVNMVSHWTYQGTASTGKLLITTSSSRLYIAHFTLGSLAISCYCVLFAACYELEVLHSELGDTFGLIMASSSSWLMSVLFVSIPAMFFLRLMKERAEGKILGRIILPSYADEHVPLLFPIQPLPPPPTKQNVEDPES